MVKLKHLRRGNYPAEGALQSFICGLCDFIIRQNGRHLKMPAYFNVLAMFYAVKPSAASSSLNLSAEVAKPKISRG